MHRSVITLNNKTVHLHQIILFLQKNIISQYSVELPSTQKRPVSMMTHIMHEFHWSSGSYDFLA